MAGKSAPAAPPDDTWIPADKGSASPAASPPKKKKSKGGSSSLRRAFSWLRGRRKKKQQKGQAGAPPAEGKKQEGRPKAKGYCRFTGHVPSQLSHEVRDLERNPELLQKSPHQEIVLLKLLQLRTHPRAGFQCEEGGEEDAVQLLKDLSSGT
uniref:Uncharacterized protein n=1 Tax=Sphaerodactylus townsendi TaxID=933632 RepID=A0ACB8FSV3_9SAUR